MQTRHVGSQLSTLTSHQRNRIEEFGKSLAQACANLESVAMGFIRWCSNNPFRSDKQCQEAFKVFKESAASSSRSQREKDRIWVQIKDVLLNPHSSSSNHKIRQLFNEDLEVGKSLSNGVKCSTCHEPGGQFVSCVGKNCRRVFHVRCAASKLYSYKHKTTYYRCCGCTAVDIEEAKDVPKGKLRFKRKKKIGKQKNKNEKKDVAEVTTPVNVPLAQPAEVTTPVNVPLAQPPSPAKIQETVAITQSVEDDCPGAQRSHLLPDADNGNCAIPKKAGGTAAIEQFQWSTLAGDNDICLATLESLSNGDSVDEDELQRIEKSALRLLKNRCVAMCNFYQNDGFLRLWEKAEIAIAAYEGQEEPSTMTSLAKELKKFGFVLTPRMWTRCEIVLIMVLLLDPNLHYLNINQKKPGLDEDLQNR